MFSSLRSRVLTLQEIPDSGHLGGERAPTLPVSLSDTLPSIKQLNFFKALHKPSAAATNVSVSATDQVFPVTNQYLPRLRILYMPPVYAIISFFSYRYFRDYTYYDLIETGEW